MTISLQRRLPIGAETLEGMGTHFRVWAANYDKVSVVLEGSKPVPLDRDGDGYFSGAVVGAKAGGLYQFQLGESRNLLPDPASRFQPLGPHGPSQIVDSEAFRWTDQSWRGVRIPRQVMYELHIGTFTPEGTWNAARERLESLAELGVTVIEVMPVADFAGNFGWGYDGVCLFAPTRLYGSPDDFRAFVDAAHGLGLGVILDVVYNHLGPDGNYLKDFSDCYFTKKYENEWGDAINFDGVAALPVREFFVSNARYWISEFHLDGLRLDATQQIFDASEENIITELTREARRAAERRAVIIVGESETQQVRLVQGVNAGGCGLDALWNDDFHHTARVAATGRKEAYYADYTGSPQELISAVRWGFLFQGQYYGWQKQTRGSAALEMPAEVFVTYLQNHDQIANSASSERLHNQTSPGRFRALTALLLLSPGTPLLFQGQEFGASAPFFYFADHKEGLSELVANGRRKFLSQFQSFANGSLTNGFPTPHDRQTFLKCKLDHAERERNTSILALHTDLLRLRRNDPVFCQQRSDRLHGAVIGPEAFLIRFFGEDNDHRLLLINLGADLRQDSIAEPLLAPPANHIWEFLWTSEDPQYGGSSPQLVDCMNRWSIPGHSATVLRTREMRRT